jgi:K+-transporting ATPase KdpF subunit
VFSCSFVGLSPKRATNSRRLMDYVVAGVASLGLFIYLIYALLRPEKF